MNQSQNSLLENLCQGNHEASDGQKSDVGVRVPVIPGDQSSPVVQPAVAPLHLPATLANWMHLGKSTRPGTTVLQLPLRYGWLNASPAKLPAEVGAVVTFVSGQASGALARSALRPWHLHPI